MKHRVLLILLVILFGCRSQSDPPMFELLSSRETGIDFANTLQEDDSLYNANAFDYLYNGGGVGVGDVNNDGLPDLYFAGNMVSSRLYLNRGELRFEDVTEVAGAGTDVWVTGVTMVDINQDGLLDIYLSVAGLGTEEQRANLLLVNQGLGSDGTPQFREQAREYGIADTGYSTHAVFLDYDRDGDLDLYVLTNGLEDFHRNLIRPRLVNGESATTDRLYRNSGDGTFTDVSREAGILIEGYGLGVNVSDLDQDGWPDLYVSNDFLSNDLVWINNRDGTFTDRAAQYLKSQSHNAMGNDVADFNNDGLVDIVVVDMLPEDNERQKMMIGGGNYDRFHMALDLGYAPQYVRNTLQLNNGPGPDGEPSFSEVGQLAGIHATDWSWAPLFADFDNDGFKDLFVSNGYRRDVTNLDYIAYSQAEGRIVGPEERRQFLLEALRELPEVRIHNYLFRNNGDLTFSNQSRAWGMKDTRFANGAAYADLDGDGDLDLVTNNLDAPASVYANRAERLGGRNFLRVVLRGPDGNRGGYGARVVARSGGQRQYLEMSSYRGYKSTVEAALHFGLGTAARVDSLEVYWLDGTYQLLTDVAVNRVVTLDHRDARPAPLPAPPEPAPMVRAVSLDNGLDYTHRERVLADFNLTPLLLRKYSQEGPGLAVGDVDGDGLDDVFAGADRGQPRALFLQRSSGRFERRELSGELLHDDMGALFFDADGDGHLDLYVVSGGNYPTNDPELYQDRLYINDGQGLLRLEPNALPLVNASGSTVVAADYDGDGDLDLFVGGRVVPGEYPMPPRSYLLRNDSRPGVPRFTDVTAAVAPDLERPGLVTSALWTDFDGDGQPDLLVTGEWMPLRFFRNDGGRFTDVSSATGLGDTRGWWNSLVTGDFDNDGDIDYVAGNLGLNSRFRATQKEPVRVYAADFDENGSIDPVASYFLDGKSYPVASRDQLIDQMIGMKGRFRRYADYSLATLERTLSRGERERAYVVESVMLESSYLENLGGGKFALRPLPLPAQVAPVYGMLVDDCDGDGLLDVMLVGNSHATETQLGRYDASVGGVLLNDGRGGFRHQSGTRTGFFVDGDAKALAEVMLGDSSSLLLVSQNNGRLRAFAPASDATRPAVRLQPLDAYVVLTFADGRTRRQELPYGSTYLSQSSRFLRLPGDLRKAVVYDSGGRSRDIQF